jgi:carbamoyl-phosphate synthase large subunit
MGAGQNLPASGCVFISVQDRDKSPAIPVARKFLELGFSIAATRGTSEVLMEKGIENKTIKKVSVGRPHVVDAIKNGEIQLIVNTGAGGKTKRDGYEIRRAAIKFKVPYVTTVAAAMAVVNSIAALKERKLSVKTIQEYHSQHD